MTLPRAGSGVVAADEPILRIRVITLNLLHGAPLPGQARARQSLEARLAWTAERLAEEDPDVILLQESSATPGRENSAAVLARHLEMSCVYAPANPSPAFRLVGAGRLVRFEEGPAVLSRFPILRHRAHRLSSRWSVVDRRIALEAVLEGPQATFSVFSVHLSGHTASGRRQQVERLVKEIEKTDHDHPLIVGGDFNAEEHAHEIRHLTDIRGWIDAFRHLHPEAPGHTWGQGLTSVAATAGKRIDFLFSVPTRGEHWRPEHSRLVLDRSFPDVRGGVLWASDHYGVLTDFVAPRIATNERE